MKTIENSITVDVPVSRAYNQWTQFEEFHLFMEGVKEVKQVDDKRLHWKAEIAGKIKEWDAEIFEQVPDQRIAWRSTGGAKNSGTISFTSLTASIKRWNSSNCVHWSYARFTGTSTVIEFSIVFMKFQQPLAVFCFTAVFG